jgi:hypothetical protein
LWRWNVRVADRGNEQALKAHLTRDQTSEAVVDEDNISFVVSRNDGQSQMARALLCWSDGQSLEEVDFTPVTEVCNSFLLKHIVCFFSLSVD